MAPEPEEEAVAVGNISKGSKGSHCGVLLSFAAAVVAGEN